MAVAIRDAEAMLETDGGALAVAVAELEQALAHDRAHHRPRVVIPVIIRRPETSESATKRCSPSVARPLGWANRASSGGPSWMFSYPEPAKTPTLSEARSSFQIWCGPAMAM